MKISKEAAKNITSKLLETKRKKLDAAYLEYRQLATDLYKSQLPNELVELQRKYPEYISKCSSLLINSHGFNWERINATEQVIQVAKGENIIDLNAKDADKLLKLKQKHEKLRKSYSELFSETEHALISLGTTKRIEENFPEAKPFLPVSENLLPVANLADLRSKIKAA